MNSLSRINIKLKFSFLIFASYLCLGLGSCFEVVPVGTSESSPSGTSVESYNRPRPAFTGLALGTSHACVLVDGGVKCWGKNHFGQLGDGSQTDSSSPVQAQGLTQGVVEIAAGGDTTCAIQREGPRRWVKCWGKAHLQDGALPGVGAAEGEEYRNLLNASQDFPSPTPTILQGFHDNVQSVAVGKNHLCITTTQGHVFCMGSNSLKQLGALTNRGLDHHSNRPSQVGMGDPIVPLQAHVPAIAGEDHTCAITKTDTDPSQQVLTCWGKMTPSLLGDLAVPALFPAGAPAVATADRLEEYIGLLQQNPLMNRELLSHLPFELLEGGRSMFPARVQSLSAGSLHTCVVMQGGVVCMGNNRFGQLGITHRHNSGQPVPVGFLETSVQKVTSGRYFNCALQNGVAKCWGRSDLGQLGSRMAQSPVTPIPVQVENLGTQVDLIAASGDHACAVENHQVKCWGSIPDQEEPTILPVEVKGF